MPGKATRVGRPRKDASRLDKDAVLEAALRLLDEGGERAVTFRALARELGVTPMAISHHVGSRHAMFASLVAMVYADVAEEPRYRAPGKRVRAMLRRYCERVIAHPHLVQCVFSDPSLMSDQLVSLTLETAENLAASGADPSELQTLVYVIVDYTHGFAISAAAAWSLGEEQAMDRPSIEDYLRGLDWLLKNIQ